MLVALMLKVDVGWGQQSCPSDCETLIENQNLQIQGITYPIAFGSASKSFQNLWVPNGIPNMWFASHNSPHHIQYNPSSGTPCNINWTSPNNTEVPCIAASLGYSEGIFTNINTNFDPLTEYCLTLNLQRLSCNQGVGTYNVKIATTNGLTAHPPINQTVPLPSIGHDVLLTQNFTNSTFQNFPQFATFKTSDFNHNQLWIYTEGISGNGWTTINNVFLNCTTSALKEIICSSNGNIVNFSSVNSSTVSTFESYLWSFGDGATSTDAEPTHIYTNSGNYEVCLEIVDNNGCCGSLCKKIVVIACPSPTASFTQIVSCAGHTNSVAFTSTSTGQGLTYHWDFGDGNSSTAQNPTHSYNNNGTYTVTLTVTDECGQISIFSADVMVQCSPIGEIECGHSTYKNAYLIDASNGDVNFAQFVTQNGVPYTLGVTWNFTNITFVIRGKVVMNRLLSFVGCNFVFDTGASLELNNTSTSQSIYFYGCKLQACNQMWKGVKSIKGKHKFLSGTEIRDAEYGIEMPSGKEGDISVNNSSFYDNIVGIYVKNNTGHNIRNTTFSSTRNNNLGAYPNQTHYFARPHAGLIFQNISSGNLGSDASPGNNTFSRLNNGVLSDNSNLICVGNNFLTEYGSNCDLTIAPNDPFEICHKWVWIKGGSNHQISFNSIRSDINGTYTSIYLYDILGGNILIQRNEIISNIYGVIFNKVKNSNQITIRQHRNQFFPNGGFHFAAGLIGLGIECANNIFEIYDNDFFKSRAGQCIAIDYANDNLFKSIRNNNFSLIYATNAGFNPYGISLNSCKDVDVNNNVIDNYSTNCKGAIRTFLCEKIRMLDNVINDHTSSLPAGILCETNSADFKIECNSIYGAPIGFNFGGSNNTNIDFRSNLMHENGTGIQVFGVFTAQRDKGNLWVGANSYARHLNGGSDTWFVNPSQTPPALFPTGSFRPVTVDPDDWFFDRDVQNIHCFGGREDGLDDEGDTPQAKAMELAGYLTDDVEDTPLLRWEWQTSLYQLLTDHPALMDADELLSTLYNEIPYTIGIYKDAFDGLSEILALTEDESSTLTNIRSTMELIQIQMDALRAQTEQEVDLEGEGSANEIPNAVEIYNQIQSLNQQLSVLKNDEASILSEIQSRINEDLDNYIADVSSLPETEVFHPEFKAMMGIKANMYRQGFEYLVSNNMAQLETIASLCYAGYGWSAAEAVSILRTMGQNVELNYGSCDGLENRNSLSTLESKSLVQIYPNPATDRITITVAGQKVSSVVIKSVDGSVQKVLAYSTDNGCDISSLPLGVYLVDVLVDGKYLSTVKFIKIK